MVVEGSKGWWREVGRCGGEVNKIKKAIIRPQHKPCNYAPKFNQNGFLNRPCQVLTPRPITGETAEPGVFLQSKARGQGLPSSTTLPSPSHQDRLIRLDVAQSLFGQGSEKVSSPHHSSPSCLPLLLISASHSSFYPSNGNLIHSPGQKLWLQAPSGRAPSVRAPSGLS